jgi:hypothetical protein
MATTTTRLTAAHLAAFMGQAISTTASSWAWDLGRTGAMATVGVSIASAVVEEEGTSVSAQAAADALMHPIVEADHRWLGPVTAAPTRLQFVVASPMVRRMLGRRIAAFLTAAASITSC